MSLIDRAEARRKSALAAMDPSEQAALGRYFTPYQAALIIAGLPRVPQAATVRVLDPGAGSGILTAALVERIQEEQPDAAIDITAVDVGGTLLPALRDTLADIEALGDVKTMLVGEDFLTWTLSSDTRIDVIIQNPPYAKLQTGSKQQNLLRAAGIDVPNIYAAFLALGVHLLANSGQQVAITPRSWMNGTYYSRFRREFVDTVGIDGIHTFESRSKVFGDTGALQAIVVSVTRGQAGGQNVLIKQMIDDFCAYFIPGGEVLYIGDADSNLMHFDEEQLTQLGVVVNTHGELPDLVVYQPEKNWLFLMEAASGHGPVDAKRYGELSTPFAGSSAGLVYVSCFPDRAVMRKFLADLAWETEAWCASDPTHMIHLNGDKFFGPHAVEVS